MNTPKIKQANISYSSAEKHAVNASSSFIVHGRNQMCPPSKRTGFVKINISKRTSDEAGYAPLAYGVAAEENRKGTDNGASSYSDFILYNYGAASDRQQVIKPGNE